MKFFNLMNCLTVFNLFEFAKVKEFIHLNLDEAVMCVISSKKKDVSQGYYLHTGSMLKTIIERLSVERKNSLILQIFGNNGMYEHSSYLVFSYLVGILFNFNPS